MHEVAIMTEAVRLATESAQAAGAHRITALKLRIGTLSGVVPDALEFVWDVVRRDTMLADARLEIESVSGAHWCEKCLTTFASREFFAECPRCQELSGDLRRGRELEIVALELE
jgi:hydrogenase nickel incorporation protein HypA/HybF